MYVYQTEFTVIICGKMFAHQNILVECFAVVLLVLLLDPFHVNFRAAHHDAGQDIFAGTFTLKTRKHSVRKGLVSVTASCMHCLFICFGSSGQYCTFMAK